MCPRCRSGAGGAPTPSGASGAPRSCSRWSSATAGPQGEGRDAWGHVRDGARKRAGRPAAAGQGGTPPALCTALSYPSPSHTAAPAARSARRPPPLVGGSAKCSTRPPGGSAARAGTLPPSPPARGRRCGGPRSRAPCRRRCSGGRAGGAQAEERWEGGTEDAASARQPTPAADACECVSSSVGRGRGAAPSSLAPEPAKPVAPAHRCSS